MKMTDEMAKVLVRREGCQYIGPEQDPLRKWVAICGAECLEDRTYCEEHIWTVYLKGSNLRRNNKIKFKKGTTMEEVCDLLVELNEELEAEEQ